MPQALLTADQSRWLLSLLVGLLSAVAIASSVPNLIETESILNGHPGDIRGVLVMIGSGGVGTIMIARLAALILPKPWRIYIDRVEFTLITMLWICWVSATMAFSAFTLGEGVCASSRPEIFIPTCPLLTFDMAILHILSIATFAHLLVILSTALSPGYYLSYSLLQDGSGSGGEGAGSHGSKIDDADGYDGFVMWDLAVSSPPASPYLGPSRGFGIEPSAASTPGSASASASARTATATTYGTTDFGPSPYAQPAPSASTNTSSTGTHPTISVPPSGRRRDKFADGRVLSYSSLLVCSIGVVGSTAVLMASGEFVTSCMLIIAVGSLSTAFALVFLRLHAISDKTSSAERRSSLRALEVGCASSLFVLWPLAAIAFTLFPSIPNRACTNPAASALPVDPDASPFSEDSPVCFLSLTVITLGWGASWIMLARLVGLVFPMPQVGADLPSITPSGNIGGGSGSGIAANQDEAQSLLGGGGGGSKSTKIKTDTGKGGKKDIKGKSSRPQVGWGRIVAGEAYELGDDEEEE